MPLMINIAFKDGEFVRNKTDPTISVKEHTQITGADLYQLNTIPNYASSFLNPKMNGFYVLYRDSTNFYIVTYGSDGSVQAEGIVELPVNLALSDQKDIACSELQLDGFAATCAINVGSDHLAQLKIQLQNSTKPWSFTWDMNKYPIYNDYTPIQNSQHINNNFLIFASNKNDKNHNFEIMVYKNDTKDPQLYDSIADAFPSNVNSIFDPEQLTLGEDLVMITKKDSRNKNYLNLVKVGTSYGLQIDDPAKFLQAKKNQSLQVNNDYKVNLDKVFDQIDNTHTIYQTVGIIQGIILCGGLGYGGYIYYKKCHKNGKGTEQDYNMI